MGFIVRMSGIVFFSNESPILLSFGTSWMEQKHDHHGKSTSDPSSNGRKRSELLEMVQQ